MTADENSWLASQKVIMCRLKLELSIFRRANRGIDINCILKYSSMAFLSIGLNFVSIFWAHVSCVLCVIICLWRSLVTLLYMAFSVLVGLYVEFTIPAKLARDSLPSLANSSHSLILRITMSTGPCSFDLRYSGFDLRLIVSCVRS